MISARRDSDERRHPGKASAAAATASSTSSTLANPTSACTTPVAGSYTGPDRPDRAGTRLPPIQWSMRALSFGHRLPSTVLGRGRGEDLDRRGDLLVGDAHRRREPQDVAVEAAFADEQAALRVSLP